MNNKYNKVKSAFQIGMTASEVVGQIVRMSPEISYLGFYIYKPRYNIKESRKMFILPILLSHDSTQETIKLKREEIRKGNLEKIVYSLEEETVIGIVSRFKINNETHHIPLMDFSCVNSHTNLKKIEWFLKEIGQQGVILSSGRSYHYYGVKPMDEKEWSNFLGDCLLSGLVDVRYIGHRCKDMCGILRLSACPLRPRIPTVVSIL